MSHSKVYIIGVGVTEFLKPRGKVSYTELGLQASVKALIDCNLTYDSIEQAYCGYIYGDSTCGQRVLYQLGMTQIPIINVNNNCATGSTALWMGRNAIRGGVADCVLCVGWEQMEAGSSPWTCLLIVGPLKGHFPNHTSPGDKTVRIMAETRGMADRNLLLIVRNREGTYGSPNLWKRRDRVHGEIWRQTRTFR